MRDAITPRELLETILNMPDSVLDEPIQIYTRNADDDNAKILDGPIGIQEITIDDFGKALALLCHRDNPFK